MFTGSLFDVVARLIRIFSIVAVVLIVAGLIGLLTDVVRDTSKVQSTRIVSPDSNEQPTSVPVDIEAPEPGADIEAVRQDEHTGGREFIDDANDVLLGPVNFLIKGSDGAVRHLLYAALGLFFYGFLLQMLADFMRRQSDGARRAARLERERKEAEERRKSGRYVSPA